MCLIIKYHYYLFRYLCKLYLGSNYTFSFPFYRLNEYNRFHSITYNWKVIKIKDWNILRYYLHLSFIFIVIILHNGKRMNEIFNNILITTILSFKCLIYEAIVKPNRIIPTKKNRQTLYILVQITNTMN